MAMPPSTKDDLLSKARSLLSDINSRKARGNVFRDSKQAAETLCSIIQLLRSLQSFFVKETVALDPSSTDWKTLKALLELLIRLGISPHFNPGVGILRDKHQDDCSSIFAHLSELCISYPSSSSSSSAPYTGMSLLYLCAEVLASFFWTTKSPSSSPSIYVPLLYKETHTTDTDTKANNTTDKNDLGVSGSSNDLGVFGSSTQHSPDTPINALSPCDITCSSLDTHLLNEAQFMAMPSITHLVLKFFLWDLMAAYLQLGFGPCSTNANIRDQAKICLKHMVEHFPVEQMVVASFVLLNRDSPTPPPWIKSELGKQLSKLVMREGGLVIVLEELVGRVTKGSIESYNKVAGHLAKVPKSVASADEYLEALSPQVLPLLILKHKPRDSVLGEISFAALNNVFHTSISLTCRLFAIEPKLTTKYILQPMMKPLLVLSSIQNSVDTVESLSPIPAELDHSERLVTEDEVVDSVVQLGVLLTAGCQGSSAAREAIFYEARVVAPLFLKLHFQLASRDYYSSSGSIKNASCVQKNRGLEGIGVRKGFLDKGLGSKGLVEQTYEDESNLLKLKTSLADIVMAVVNQPVESALCCVMPFLLEHTMEMVRWPQEEGEVWDTLQAKGFQSQSKVMYLSRLLLMVENWPLVVATLGKLLHKVLNARLRLKGGDTEFSKAAELLRHMQDFEVLNSEVGMKALEYDTCGAASLVKTLLEDELVLYNEEMLELVLHMVYSVLKGIRTTRGDDSQTNSGHGAVLNDLLSSLRKVYGNAQVEEKSRQMSFTLAKEVSALCNTS